MVSRVFRRRRRRPEDFDGGCQLVEGFDLMLAKAMSPKLCSGFGETTCAKKRIAWIQFNAT
ncbi:hypothetical protein FJW06_19650 [Mesorhizobium sp. B4-1-3]|uniref:hypothetical protein n=1 Tax=Mesorhizobium sp. B4-1-3 TaxID=2589889 RepID=UPI001128DD10|nr:hypothetical protein [Mesorhizobium sp. B4-1-3]TPI11583.1 hypothetical protein FJW06_19650 [Mesorhizobium sp. B4-1-3]